MKITEIISESVSFQTKDAWPAKISQSKKKYFEKNGILEKQDGCNLAKIDFWSFFVLV